MKKLAIISTHPIQYNAPLFKLLTESGNMGIKVFYTWSQSIHKVKDKGFGKSIEWDIPLLDGYDYEVVENTAKRPGVLSFRGIKNPTLIPKIKNYAPDAILIYGWNFLSHFKTMRHFKNKIPVWFRGDSTLLDYDIQSLKQLFKSSHQHINTSTHQLPKTFGINKSTLKQLIKFKLRQTILTYIYKHIDTAFYVGTNNKAYFKKMGLKEHQLKFAPHAIDNKRFEDSPEKQYEQKAKVWRKELGINEKDIVILFCGKLEPKKNPILLLNTFIELLNDNHKTFNPKPNSDLRSPASGLPSSNLHLLFVGSGLLESQLKKIASGFSTIHFLPFQNQSKMPLVYRLADVLCLPSKGPGETWGLAVNEAMASGLAIIVSEKVGCAADLISKNGFIFQHNNGNELKNCMYTLTNDLQLIELYKKNSIDLINNYTFSQICKIIDSKLKYLSE